MHYLAFDLRFAEKYNGQATIVKVERSEDNCLLKDRRQSRYHHDLRRMPVINDKRWSCIFNFNYSELLSSLSSILRSVDLKSDVALKSVMEQPFRPIRLRFFCSIKTSYFTRSSNKNPLLS